MPAHVSMPLRLKDGTRVYLRPLRSTDREQYVAELLRLSPQSRYERFLTVFDHVTDDMADQLVDDVDGVYHVAVVLLTDEGDEPVAVGRFIRDRSQPDHAEVAFGVRDDRHGQGAGGIIAAALKGLALELDVRYFTATVLSSNRASLRMMSGFGRTVQQEQAGHGVIEMVVDLNAKPYTGARSASGGADRGQTPDGSDTADTVGPTQEIPVTRHKRSQREPRQSGG